MTNKEAISIMKVIIHMLESEYDTDRIEEAVEMSIKALEQTRWIPVKWHIKTEEDEYERYPDGVVMIDSPMPEDGQEVLVTIKGKNGKCWVDKDIACCDDDGWYTDGGHDWVDDIIAWMPLPEPYKAESEDEE